MGPIEEDFDGIFPRFDLWDPLRQILMTFCLILTYEVIKADFDGILPPFDLWGLLRQILMAFCPLLIYGTY